LELLNYLIGIHHVMAQYFKFSLIPLLKKDSYHLELISKIEKKYNVELDFSEKDASEFMTLGGFAKSILELVLKKNEQ